MPHLSRFRAASKSGPFDTTSREYSGGGRIAFASSTSLRLSSISRIFSIPVVTTPSPAPKTIAYARWADWNPHFGHLGGQLIAGPSLAVQGQQFFAQRIEDLENGPAPFGRPVHGHFVQLALNDHVIKRLADLVVVDALAHVTMTRKE